jgi:hypothetical protein
MPNLVYEKNKELFLPHSLDKGWAFFILSHQLLMFVFDSTRENLTTSKTMLDNLTIL